MVEPDRDGAHLERPPIGDVAAKAVKAALVHRTQHSSKSERRAESVARSTSNRCRLALCLAQPLRRPAGRIPKVVDYVGTSVQSGPFWYKSLAEGELEMIKGLLTSMGFAGLVAASAVQGVVAAPIAPAASEDIAPQGQSLEVAYYYNGRHYAYHHNNRYYAHRVYRHNHWHYY